MTNSFIDERKMIRLDKNMFSTVFSEFIIL